MKWKQVIVLTLEADSYTSAKEGFARGHGKLEMEFIKPATEDKGWWADVLHQLFGN